MAEMNKRIAKFRDAAAILADDAISLSAKLAKYIDSSDFEKAEAIADGLQRAARDTKWLMRRLPKEG